MSIMECSTLSQVAKIFLPRFFISAFPHVLPHIKYSQVLSLKISIINKQNSCFCFEMEHHAVSERKHLHKFVIVNLPKNPGIFHLQDGNIVSDNIQSSKQHEFCKPSVLSLLTLVSIVVPSLIHV